MSILKILDFSIVDVRCAHIINFDVPIRAEEYVQRICRTNQTGNKPNVITFYDETKDTIMKVFNRIVEAAEL